MRRQLFLSVLAAVGLCLVAADARPDEPPRLFVDVQPDEQPVPPDGRYHQTFTVRLNMEALKQPAQRVLLNLPDQEPEIVELDFWSPRQGYIQIADPNDPTGMGSITIPDPNARPEDFRWRWYGKSGNYTVALTTVKGVAAGRVTGGARRYGLEPTGVGEARLGLINSSFWKTHPDDNRPKFGVRAQAEQPASVTQVAAPSDASASVPSGGGWDPWCTSPPPGGQQVIDVLFLYTEGLLARYLGNLEMMESIIEIALDDANQALRNSLIPGVVFSLRGIEPVPNPAPAFDYDDPDIEAALHKLGGFTPAPAPVFYTFTPNTAVAARREAMWADIVALARADISVPATCGVSEFNRYVVNNGYPREPGLAFKKFAYLVFDPQCNADRLNLAHELGHQLGVEHDPTNYEEYGISGIMPACPWAFEHKHSNADPTYRYRFRTAGAYWQDNLGHPGGPPSCLDDDNCPLIDAFSTPLLEWAGRAAEGGPPPFGLQPYNPSTPAQRIGVVSLTSNPRPANAADVIKRVAPTVQDYYDRPNVIFENGFQ